MVLHLLRVRNKNVKLTVVKFLFTISCNAIIQKLNSFSDILNVVQWMIVDLKIIIKRDIQLGFGCLLLKFIK